MYYEHLFSFKVNVNNPVEIFTTLKNLLSTNKKFRSILIQEAEKRFGGFGQLHPLSRQVALLNAYLFPYHSAKDSLAKTLLWLFSSKHLLCNNGKSNSRLAQRINHLILRILTTHPIKMPRGICETIEEKLENIKDCERNSLFHWIPFIGMTQFFRANDINLNLLDPYGLYQAVLDNDAQLVRHLLETKKISPNGILNNRGETPLAFFAREAVRRIDPNHAQFLYSPLHLAVIKGRFEIVKILLKHPEIDINIQGITSRKTPLFYAMKHERFNIAKLLIKHPKIIIDKHDVYGNSLLHVGTPTVQSREIVGALLRKHSNPKEWVNQGNNELDTPLHKTSLWGNFELVRQLVKYGADVNARNEVCDTPIHLAAFKRYYKICHHLHLENL